MESFFNTFAQYLRDYPYFAYILIFLGSFFDTLIPVSFFVYGEIAFLVGSVLAGLGELDIFWVALFCYLGGFLGDNSSFFIGRKYGKQALLLFSKLPFLKRFFTDKKQREYKDMFDKNGAIIVFVSRVGGPMAWIMPFIAGTFSFSYKKFLLYNTAGVFLGISFFLLVGYFLGANFALFRIIFQTYFPIFSFLLFLILAFFLGRKYFLFTIKQKNG